MGRGSLTEVTTDYQRP